MQKNNLYNLLQKLFPLFALLIIFSVSSCETNDCETVVCAPNSTFQFQLIDKNSGENLLANGTYQISNLNITTTESESEVGFELTTENAIVSLETPNNTESINYAVQISSENLFQVAIEKERITGECCSVINFTSVAISSVDFQINSELGTYTILIE